MCIVCAYTSLKDVSHYYLSVQVIFLIGVNKWIGGWFDGVSSIQLMWMFLFRKQTTA